ncbi:hypothetical protein ISS03_04605 [Patescibacteria group bacterium]|nr:hypothetical protein [Patescibacteria group bacterium]
MNNEQLILNELKKIDTRLSSLEQGQTKLEQGITRLESRVSSVEQGQTKLEQGQAKLEQGQTKLEQGQTKLEQGQTKLEQKIEDEIGALARMTQNGFDEQRKEFKDDIFKFKVELEHKIEAVEEKAKEYRDEVISLLVNDAVEIQNAKNYQAINISVHDKLKKNIDDHETRIKVLEHECV